MRVEKARPILAEGLPGEFLKDMPRNRGNMGVFKGRDSSGSHVMSQPEGEKVPTLSEMGIERQQSSRAQKLADIPAPEFAQRIEAAKETGKLTTAAVLKTRRVQNVWSRSVWERQTRSIMTSWLESVPEEDRTWAVKYLSDLPSEILLNEKQ